MFIRFIIIVYIKHEQKEPDRGDFHNLIEDGVAILDKVYLQIRFGSILVDILIVKITKYGMLKIPLYVNSQNNQIWNAENPLISMSCCYTHQKLEYDPLSFGDIVNVELYQQLIMQLISLL
jgi:hypothetical protein